MSNGRMPQINIAGFWKWAFAEIDYIAMHSPNFAVALPLRQPDLVVVLKKHGYFGLSCPWMLNLRKETVDLSAFNGKTHF